MAIKQCALQAESKSIAKRNDFKQVKERIFITLDNKIGSYKNKYHNLFLEGTI